MDSMYSRFADTISYNTIDSVRLQLFYFLDFACMHACMLYMLLLLLSYFECHHLNIERNIIFPLTP